MNNKIKIALGLFVVTDIAIGYIGYQLYNNKIKTENNVKEIVASINKELPKSLVANNVYKSGFLNSSGEYTVEDKKSKNTIKIIYNIDHGFKTLLNKKTFLTSSLTLSGEINQIIKPVGNALFEVNGEIGEHGVIDVAILSKGFTLEDKNRALTKVVFGPSNGKLYHDNNNKLINDYEFSKVEVLQGKENSSFFTVSGLGYKYSSPNWKGVVTNFELFVNKVSSKDVSASNVKVYFKAEDIKNKYNMSSGLSIANVAAMREEGSFNLALSYKGLEKSPIDFINSEFIKQFENSNELYLAEPKNIEKYKDQILVLIQKGFVLSLDNFEVKSKNINVNVKAKLEVKPVNNIKDISLEDNTKIVVNTQSSGDLIDMYVPLVVGKTGQEPTKYTDGSYKTNAYYENHKFFVDNKENVNATIQVRQSLRNMDISLGYDRQLPPLVQPIEIPLEEGLTDPALEGLHAEDGIRKIQ